MRALFLLIPLLPAIAAAELTYPVDHTATWQVIDTTDCSLVGGPRAWPALDPDTYDCETEPCGIDPGWPENYAALQIMPVAGPIPDYDGNLTTQLNTYLTCGPSTELCYDNTTVHVHGVGCAATDTYQAVAILSDTNVAQRLDSLFNVAAVSTQDAFNSAQLTLSGVIGDTLASILLNGAELPTQTAAGVNLQYVWAAIYGSTAQRAAVPDLYQVGFPSIREPASMVVDRLAVLVKKVLDAETCRLDPSNTTACDNAIQDYEIADPTGWPVPAE